ncbi:lipoxygenase family protein [Gillisia sp. Q332]|uniref:lipoxygenase family protein n=1 Tax=Gillisia xinjiangensis TaxID=3384765 RepID=UPI003918A2A6
MSLYPPATTEDDIEKVYLESYNETKIGYSNSGNFFSPNFKSINHLEVGNSRMINSFLVRAVEYLLTWYQRFILWLKKKYHALFPRIEKITGTAKDAYITGKLTFAKRSDYARGLHHMPVELWGRTRLGAWHLFTKGESDEKGVFKLKFDYLVSRRWRYKTFHLEIYQIQHVYFKKENGHPDIKLDLFERIKIPKGDLTGLGYDLGNIQLCYWEYRDDTKLPRVVIKDHEEDAPEYYSDGRNEAIQQQFVPIQLLKDKHLLQIKLDKGHFSLKDIQNDYPKNLTVAMEEKLPYSTRCDYWFGRRMMNGMNCATFIPDPEEKNRYWVRFFGACDYQVNDEYAFPTVEIKFYIPPDKLPIPEQIITTGPTNNHEKSPFSTHIFTPADGERWECAKRVARVTGALCTELDDHFAGTHVNTEQFAIAARRNLRRSPLTILLFPHLKEVALINFAADTILIGPGYIPRASAVTAAGMEQRCADMMGVLDWKNWEPMEIINSRHTYAQAENLFWEVVTEYVDTFFEQFEEDIRKEWPEVFLFSEDLVNHSLPAFQFRNNGKIFSAEEQAFENKRVEYYHARFRYDPDLPRRSVDGVPKAISPITLNPDAPLKEDWENLKQACKYIIMQATFMHTWVNEHQYEDIGEVLYSSLGLRFGNSEEGIFLPESDHSISPDLTRATQMMWFSNLLSRTEYGFITRNEENDIDHLFCELLEKRRSAFKELYVEIDNIESRTNI